jgi:hypothetical protein
MKLAQGPACVRPCPLFPVEVPGPDVAPFFLDRCGRRVCDAGKEDGPGRVAGSGVGVSGRGRTSGNRACFSRPQRAAFRLTACQVQTAEGLTWNHARMERCVRGPGSCWDSAASRLSQGTAAARRPRRRVKLAQGPTCFGHALFVLDRPILCWINGFEALGVSGPRTSRCCSSTPSAAGGAGAVLYPPPWPARQDGVVLPRSIVVRLRYSDLYCTCAPNSVEVW